MKLFFYLSLFLFTNQTFSETESIDLINLLKKDLSIKESKKGSEQRIEYCPDQTCDVLEFPANVKSEEVAKFSTIFFGFGSGYYSLDKFRKKNKSLLNKLIKEQKSECSKSTNIGHCLIKKMAKNLSIRLFSVNYDEGQRCEVENLFEDILANRTSSVKFETKCLPAN